MLYWVLNQQCRVWWHPVALAPGHQQQQHWQTFNYALSRFRMIHDDVIKLKHFPRNWPFVQGMSPVSGEFPAQMPVICGALIFSLICVWINMINGWVNIREAGDLRRHRAHYDVSVMKIAIEQRLKSGELIETISISQNLCTVGFRFEQKITNYILLFIKYVIKQMFMETVLEISHSLQKLVITDKSHESTEVRVHVLVPSSNN